jgi:hypothetical protein
MFHPWSYSLAIRFIESSSSSHSSSHPSVNSHCRHLPCHQVLKGGIVSDSRIHAFILDPSSLKHFVRFIFVCQPPTIIDIQDIRSRDSTPVYTVLRTFFHASSSICPRIRAISRFRFKTHGNHSLFFPILALCWNPGKN